jgi:hypothetical protein
VAITRPGALLNATAIGDGPTGEAITGGVITCNHKLNNNSTVILCRDMGWSFSLEIEYESAAQLRGIFGVGAD